MKDVGVYTSKRSCSLLYFQNARLILYLVSLYTRAKRSTTTNNRLFRFQRSDQEFGDL